MKKKRSIFIKRVVAWLLTLVLVVPMIASNTVFADDENTEQKKDFSGYITGNTLNNAEGKPLGNEEGESVDINDALTLHYDYAITDSISVDDIYKLPVPSGIELADTASGSAILDESGEIGTLYGDSGTGYYIRFTSDIAGTNDAPAAGALDLSGTIVQAAVEEGKVKITLVHGKLIELSVTGINESLQPTPTPPPLQGLRTNFGEFFTTSGNPFATMTKAVLTVKRNNVYVDVASNATLSLGDELAIRYEWHIEEGDLMEFMALQPTKKLEIGSTFELPDITYVLPDSATTYEKDILVKVNGKDETLGLLSWNTGSGNTSFEFKMEFDDNNSGGIQNGYFEYNCKLDGTQIGDNDEVINITVGTTTYTITVEERKKVETKLEKKGEYQDGIVSWEAAITAGTVNNSASLATPGLIADNADFKDELPVGLTYIEDSFEYRIGDTGNYQKPDPSDPFSITDDGDDSATIVWRMPKLAVGEKLNIRYKTALSDKTVKNSTAAADYENHASFPLENGDTMEATAKVHIDASGSRDQWIDKVPLNGDFNPATKETSWELIINGNSRNIEDVYIYDVMSSEQNIEGTVTFKGADGYTAAVPYQAANSKWSDIDKYIAKITRPTYVTQGDYKIIEFNLSSIPSEKIKKGSKITYTTKLSKDYGTGTGLTGVRDFYNGAWLEFTWKSFDGIGPDLSYEAPGVGIEYEVKALDVQKDFVKYDRSNHKITWRVTINGDHFTMNDIKVTDTIGKKQEYDNGSIKNAGYTSVNIDGKEEATRTPPEGDISVTGAGTAETDIVFHFASFSDDNNSSTDTNDFGTDKVSFEFDTIVTNPDDYANGNTLKKDSANYKNKVTVTGTINTEASKAVSAEATAIVETQVLEKTVTKYNYKDRTMTWTVAVNHNEMQMEEVELEDIIPEGMYLLKDTIAIQTNPENKPLQFTYQDSAGNNLGETDCQSDKKLILSLGTIHKKLVITYTTKVDVNYASSTYNSLLAEHKDKVFKNAVTLRRKTYDNVTTEKSCTVENPFVKKTGKAIGTSGKQDAIAYEIFINPNSVELPANAGANFLYDKLPPSLELDENSIILQECSMGDTAGKIEFIDGNELTGIRKEPGANPGDGIGTVPAGQYVYTYNKATGELFVYVPSGISKPYHLKFNAFIVQLTNNSEEITNTAAFGSLIGSTSSGETAKVNVNLRLAGAAETGTRTGNAAFVKTNTSGAPLAGAEFTLKSKSASITKVDTVTSGADGRIEFPAKSLGDYVLTETKAPAGYMLDTRTYNVKIGKMKDAATKRIVPYYSIKLGDTALGEKDGSYILQNRSLGKIIVKKVAENQQTALQGATFTIEKKNDSTFAQRTQVTGADGITSFDGLEEGTYIITETIAPEGYQIDVAAKEVTIDGAGSSNPIEQEVTFVNYICGNILVQKTTADTKLPLSGATFTLNKIEADGSKVQVGDPQVTDADGKITFRNLMYGQYEVVETAAAPGYILNTKTEVADIQKGDEVKTVQFENEPFGKIIVQKKAADTKQPLAEATFALYAVDASGNKTQIGEPKQTDADGNIIFSDLAYGKYAVIETLAAAGYILDSTPHLAEVGTGNWTETIDVQNEPYGKITIQKTNAATEEAIMGAEFALMSGTTVLKTGVTDENGSLTFTDVSDGTFEVVETKPAVGYMPNTTTYTVTVDRVKLHPILPIQNQHYGVLDIIKVGPGNEPEKLKEVEFALYKIESPLPAETPAVTKAPEETPAAEPLKPTIAPDAVPVAVKTTNENGTLTFDTLAYGDYILKETKTVGGYVLNEYPLDVITISKEKYHFEFTIVNEKEKSKPSGGGNGGGGGGGGFTPDPSNSPSPTPSVTPSATPSATPAVTKTPKPQKTIHPSTPTTRKPNVPSDSSNPIGPYEGDLDLTDPDVPTGYSSPIVPGEPAGVEIGDEDVARGALDPEVKIPAPILEQEKDLSLLDMDPATGYKLPQTGERSGADTLVLIGGCLVLLGGIFLGINKLKARKKE